MRFKTPLASAAFLFLPQAWATEGFSGPLRYDGLILRKTGQTETNQPLFNDIHRSIDQSILRQTISFLTGEQPSRVEQYLATPEPLLFNYDVQEIGQKLLKHMIKAQNQPPTAPPSTPATVFPPYGPQSGISAILFAWAHYVTYGDIAILKENYGSFREFLDEATSHAQSNILIDSLGDWGANDTTTPKDLVGTAKYAQGAHTMFKIAHVLDHIVDSWKYEALHEDILEAFNKKFRNATNPYMISYGSGSQASDALALDIGAVNASDQQAVETHSNTASIGPNGYFWSVGAAGLPALFRYRSINYTSMYFLNELMLKTDYPTSYGYTLAHPNDTEHIISDYGDTWIYSLAGMRQAEDSVAWKKILFEPVCVENLTYASTQFKSVRGLAAATWEQKNITFEYNVTVPATASGEITIQSPLNNITINGQLYQNQTLTGVKSVGQIGTKTRINVGPGNFSISAKNKEMYFCGQK
ncbi:Alpha-L-rhamnosidase [Pseudocercospora fuligena]|uniref:alpha-L-rhamnosidase n=1 Tax=Pseudocercospora fuligena TaxID=685502 RepID=A0A8H6VIU5_9PEZI|nr:Alpha-L-rhamnosidase [Pseudocercospora fuligena]